MMHRIPVLRNWFTDGAAGGWNRLSNQGVGAGSIESLERRLGELAGSLSGVCL